MSELTPADMEMIYCCEVNDFSTDTLYPVIVFTSAPTLEKRAYIDTSLDDRRGRCQDCLGHLHAGGRSCVAINSRQEQHNIRSNFNTG